MSKKRVVIIGGAGNGAVLAQIIMDMQRAGDAIELVGFLNDHHSAGELLFHWPVLGKSSQWQELDKDILFVFALLSVGKMRERADLLKSLAIPSSRMATLIHPSAMIGFDSQIGAGSVICSQVSIQPQVNIGENVMVRAGANIGHDVQVSNYVDIGPNVCLCGYSSLSEGVHVAANAVVRDGLSLGAYSVVGAGSALLKDAGEGSTWLGNPARRVS
ncbi:NeuD/PglB/VioB family sugar acetyltransferase [Shewanella sp. 1_MG-2023]|uniref:NeuD/PglB/VioB family sugar acetyltransferase n=1 Tax=unclassified Shewanella TaxID=196818 RepID=UPI0026E19207|nr:MULTISPECIES: NeuD/PglB/VioB family sugar acetyltransferase [unclassified Shewanella]MDO6612448.1 NeuD/PglB/VioB family sugar acetyltransferase [Shewanella sp. 7_MG-2023]MDO6772511.1 NeuD/PglB/VioB family sugar acetyltransferase [Shewanella sp. 2_MG-2023]MDO6794491.1 NeuD/PglB/VioB family sugar acetyltransferase [Shewanella sp. 1_MG-2023]